MSAIDFYNVTLYSLVDIYQSFEHYFCHLSLLLLRMWPERPSERTVLNGITSQKTETVIQNIWLLRLCPSSEIKNTRKQNVPKTGSFSVFR
jgi:hypothetical protein